MSKKTDPTHNNCCPSQNNQKSRFDFIFYGSLSGVGILYISSILIPSNLTNHKWLVTMSDTTYHMVNSVWIGVIMGMIFVGILTKIPREFIMSILGRGGSFSGLLRATSAGVLLDLCSHGILMVAAKLYERGASTGQVMAFLLASPWNSLSLTIILISLIGALWTVTFIILSMVIALITGWVFDKLVGRNILPQNPNKTEISKDFKFWPEAKSQLKKANLNKQFFKDMCLDGAKDSKMVIRWLLFGIMLASLLRAFLDVESFKEFFGPTILGLTITVVVATILEICSEGSTPIAADILNRAKAPGNSFAFLMSGVSTDYTEIMVLKDTTKSWKIALFLPLITLPQIILIAWMINVSNFI
ncbi:MAG: ATPase [Rickettsiales bacterium]|jgi:uncharacterized protein|nr:ATPase [Rickettsiales bacterium]